MSDHSLTFWKITWRPCGIQATRTVTARMVSQQTYSPQAAVYSSWILAVPVQKDISQRPANTKNRNISKYFMITLHDPGAQQPWNTFLSQKGVLCFLSSRAAVYYLPFRNMPGHQKWGSIVQRKKTKSPVGKYKPFARSRSIFLISAGHLILF